MEKYKFLSFQYFEGKITEKEEKTLLDFIASSPHNKILFRDWENEWYAAFRSEETDMAWQKLVTHIDNDKTKEAIKTQRRWLSGGHKWMRIAAVFAGLILLSVAYLVHRNAESEEYAFIVEAPLGERSRMVLPDGTLIWLNSGSHVEYSAGFRKNNRTIRLIGEAYFEVKKNEEIPFIVQTTHCSVKVLGTKFNVSAYPDDDFTETTLIEGGVELTSDLNEPVRMTPGERIVYDHKTSRMHKEYVTAENFSSWTCSRLDFEQITLKDLMKKLSRKYNVKITIASEELAEKKFSGSLINGETLIEVLSAISLIIPIEIIYENDEVFICE